MTHIKLLAYIAQVSMEQQCILPKQYEQISSYYKAEVNHDMPQFAG